MTRRRNQKTNRFHVFEFAEEDDSAERESKKYLSRFKNQQKICKPGTPVDKGKFLQFFTQASRPQVKTNRETICLDVEVVVDSTSTPKVETRKRANVIEGIKAWEKKTSAGIIYVDTEGNYNSPNNIYDVDSGLPSTSLNHENEEVSKVSGVYQMTGRSYSLDSRFSLTDDEASAEKEVSSNGFNGCEAVKMAAEKEEVVIPADFIVYGGRFYGEAVVIFSCTSLKIEASVTNGNKQAFSCDWLVDDIVKIMSQWYCKVENATVHIVFESKGSREVRLANKSSGFESLLFSADDSAWPKREESIKSLNDKYSHIWSVFSDTDRETAEIAVWGQKGNFSSRPYFPEHIENSIDPFTAVVYPKDDPDAVSLGKRELELLQPETFINDTIIDFYIKYLRSTIRSEEEHRFHFFNSFFFRKLADQDKDLSSSCESREAFERVRKWTRGVDIFQKDYIFIPVNYSLHWSLVVICHPGEVAPLKDETEEVSKVPCILHMNSIRGSHRGLKNLFQSYLCEEWKERHCDATDDILSKFLHLQFITLELPQQQNSYDCGLFLLHYVELFLREAPDNFSYFRITDLSNILNRNWFHPSEASKKRFHIRELICKILNDQFHNRPSDNEHDSLQLPDESQQETEVQIVEKMYCSTRDMYDMRPEMKILTEATSSPVLLKSKDRPSTFKLSEMTISTISFYGKDFQRSSALHRGNTMSLIEEVEESKEVVLADLQPDKSGQQITWSVAGSHSISRYGNDVEMLERCSSSHESSVEILEDENQNLQEHEVSSVCPRSNKCEASSLLSEDLEDCIIEDSQDGDDICEVLMSRCAPPSLPNDPTSPSHQEAEWTTPKLHFKGDEGITSCGDSMPRAENQVLKRPKYITLS